MTDDKPQDCAELLPCPFCGGEAHLGDVFDEKGVVCEKGCVTIYGDFEEDAREAWNTRSAPPDTVTLCESEKQNHINSSCESTVCLSREMVDCVLSFIEELGVFGGKYPYVNGTQLLVDSRQILTKLRAEMDENSKISHLCENSTNFNTEE